MSHAHQIYARYNGPESSSLVLIASEIVESDQPGEEIIRELEIMAKALTAESESALDAYLYKIDGEVEFFVSKYFYLWPNFLDREDVYDRKSFKKGKRA